MSARHQTIWSHIPFGLKDGRMVSVAEVGRGKNCGCICAECLAPLVARKGAKKTHHFAHKSGALCVGGFMTAVHRMAQQIVLDHKVILFPGCLIRIERKDRREGRHFLEHCIDPVFVVLEDPRGEVWLGDLRRRPDIFCTRDGEQIAIEIKVTHAVPGEKIASFAEHGVTAFEIDLARVDEGIGYDSLADMVLRESSNRAWLFMSQAEQKRQELADLLDEEIRCLHLAWDKEDERNRQAQMDAAKVREQQEEESRKVQELALAEFRAHAEQDRQRRKAELLAADTLRRQENEEYYALEAKKEAELPMVDDGPIKARRLGLVDDRAEPLPVFPHKGRRSPRNKPGAREIASPEHFYASEEQQVRRLENLYGRYQSDGGRSQRQADLREMYQVFITLDDGPKYEACAQLLGVDVTEIPDSLICCDLGEQFGVGTPSAVWTLTVAAKYLFPQLQQSELFVFCAIDIFEFLEAIFIKNEGFEAWKVAYLQLCKYLSHLVKTGYLQHAERLGQPHCFSLPPSRANQVETLWSALLQDG